MLSFISSPTKEPLLNITIGQQLSITAKKYPDKEALVSCYENKRFTFSEVRDKVDHLAAGYLRLGLKRGDKIAIWCPNSMEWYLTALAAARVGLISVLVNPFLQGPELQYCLNKVQVRAIMTTKYYKSQNFLEILEGIKAPCLEFIVVDSDEFLPSHIKQTEVSTMGLPEIVQSMESAQSGVNVKSAATIMFTSGTTSNPKAVVLSHFSLLNYGHYSGKAIDNHNQIFCCLAPFFHAMGFSFGMISALVHGATLVIPTPSFDPVQTLYLMLKENCTIACGTPTMFVDLLKFYKELDVTLDHLTEVFLGGSSCSPQLMKDLKKTLGLSRVYVGYGLSETCGAFMSINRFDSDDKVLYSVGKLLDHGEAKVIDKVGEVVPLGSAGELCYRGYQTMLGYYDDVKATNKVLTEDGWFKTG